MINIKKLIIAGMIIVLLNSCGGGSTHIDNTDISDDVTTPDIDDTVFNPLKKTGQTSSYDVDGNIDDSILDDGYYRTGVSSHYSRDNNKEIVTDHITGLMWADDDNVANVTKQWLTDDNYVICDADYSSPACFDTSSDVSDSQDDTATEYCTSLTLGGYEDWRLPTINELIYIVDRSQIDPALDSTFQNVDERVYYLSSTTIVSHENFAWGIVFNSGSNNFIFKNHNYRVRCVRDEQ